MRSLFLAVCTALSLAACAGPEVVPLASLPDYSGNVSHLFLLTPSSTLATRDVRNMPAGPTREAGAACPDWDASRTTHFKFVEGWEASESPELPVGTSATVTISQRTTGKQDSLEIYAGRYTDGAVATILKELFGAHARVRDAYVLNSRYFGMQLSDERFVLFDRSQGQFLDRQVDMRSVDDLVYVDSQGQPYLRKIGDKGELTPVKKLTFPDHDTRAPLAASEIFAQPASADNATQ